MKYNSSKLHKSKKLQNVINPPLWIFRPQNFMEFALLYIKVVVIWKKNIFLKPFKISFDMFSGPIFIVEFNSH